MYRFVPIATLQNNFKNFHKRSLPLVRVRRLSVVAVVGKSAQAKVKLMQQWVWAQAHTSQRSENKITESPEKTTK